MRHRSPQCQVEALQDRVSYANGGRLAVEDRDDRYQRLL
jgi:hypothetical protein